MCTPFPNRWADGPAGTQAGGKVSRKALWQTDGAACSQADIQGRKEADRWAADWWKDMHGGQQADRHRQTVTQADGQTGRRADR
jgi:hypothetical protein